MGKKINVRAVVSISLLFLFVIVVVFAVLIEIFDHAINAHEYLYISRRIHSIAGYLFVIFAIIHIAKNRKVLKGYIKNKKSKMG